jgi:hypothetical protein
MVRVIIRRATEVADAVAAGVAAEVFFSAHKAEELHESIHDRVVVDRGEMVSLERKDTYI